MDGHQNSCLLACIQPPSSPFDILKLKSFCFSVQANVDTFLPETTFFIQTVFPCYQVRFIGSKFSYWCKTLISWNLFTKVSWSSKVLGRLARPRDMHRFKIFQVAFVFPLLLAISFLTWIFSASLSSRFTSCQKKRYPFQHSLSLVWMAFLSQ